MNEIPIVSTAYLNDEKSFARAAIECPEHIFETIYDLVQAYDNNTGLGMDSCRVRFIRWYLLQYLRVRMRPFWSPSLVASSNGAPNHIYTMPPFPKTPVSTRSRPAMAQSSPSRSESEKTDSTFVRDYDHESDDDNGDYDDAFYAQFEIENEPTVIPEHAKNSPDLLWYLCDSPVGPLKPSAIKWAEKIKQINMNLDL
mmetsp:Transcript_4109/g.6981  ORF Transcript_4109/g.6981 Transcript_4109/m.6981 type:complete len:198 (+) Transcript_4109:115-708(+)|eukprot:CAMPEP_0202685968 /NCGR_PEP_ID=MMETSP1385-20130828/1759_1 /ASSEMBLY_ACC=CAM_ASM_000861 /TAXON_ID=933848 /ORGANISM="Elphidium margaritaceum" /LENGTH=197 /DNA_ID=CAMNT_0049340443 /DNA_START=82 /DNA_END=675 /DNA_ORIENTATION=+